VRATTGDHTTSFKIAVLPSFKIAVLKNMVETVHGIKASEQRLIYVGRTLTDDTLVKDCGLYKECVVTLVTTTKHSLCPHGAELADVENGAALDTEIALYVSRLCHTNALTKLVQLIGEGGLDIHELMEVNDDVGAKIRGRLTFHSASHMITFTPRSPLRPATVYTVTLKRAMMHLKKEVAELGNCTQQLSDVITQPQYSFTFTTTDSPWRKLAIYRRHQSAPWPTERGQLSVAFTVVLKNADEVVEGLRVLAADALDVDEDDDILSLHSVTNSTSGSLQFAAIDHSNVSTLANGDMLLATLKDIEPPSKKQRTSTDRNPTHTNDAQATGASSSSDGGSSADMPERRSARERMVELRDLLDSGLISEHDFEAKKQAILDSI